MATITGRAKARDGETAACDCCGREIVHLVYLSDGRTVGRACAMRVLGFPKTKVDTAPTVAASLDMLGGFFGYVMIDGRIMKATRGYAPGGKYTDWKLVAA